MAEAGQEGGRNVPGVWEEVGLMERNIFPISVPTDINGGVEQHEDKNNHFSRKVFIGGIPPNTNVEIITSFFAQFGTGTIDYPHLWCCKFPCPQEGFVFVVYDDENAVDLLVNNCTMKRKKLFITLKDSKHRAIKMVEVRPWLQSDQEYNSELTTTSGDRYSVVINGFPSGMRATQVAKFLRRNIAQPVRIKLTVEAETNYPTNTAYVVVRNRLQYVDCISVRDFTMFTRRGPRQLTVEPYVDNSFNCELCLVAKSSHFCAHPICLCYTCDACYFRSHASQRAYGGYNRRGILYHPCHCVNGRV